MPAVICTSPGHVEAVLTAQKTRPCPNCQKIGFLNRHGVLLGYDDQHPCKKSIRANRVFCNNRASASGCGHTFSVWLAETIKRLSLSAQRLWLFLSSAAVDSNKATAFEALESSLSLSTDYRSLIHDCFRRGRCRVCLTGTTVSMNRWQIRNLRQSAGASSVAVHMEIKHGWNQSLVGSAANRLYGRADDLKYATYQTKTPDTFVCSLTPLFAHGGTGHTGVLIGGISFQLVIAYRRVRATVAVPSPPHRLPRKA